MVSTSALRFRRILLGLSSWRTVAAPRCIHKASEIEDVNSLGTIDFDTNAIDAQLELKRDKSRLKPHMRRRMLGIMETDLVYDFQVTLRNRRKLYAKFGRASGIDPKILWRSAAELERTIDMEKQLEPDLQTMLDNIKKSDEQEIKQIKEREAEVERKLAKMGDWMLDLQRRKEAKIGEALAVRQKKEQLIEEVRQYFGYKLLPNDPKFMEVLEKKEKEERKIIKEARKKERLSHQMAKLASMAASTAKQQSKTEPESKPKPQPSSSSAAETGIDKVKKDKTTT